MTRHEPLHTAGLIAAGAATLAMLAACGGPSTANAKSTAMNYFAAVDAGDNNARCSMEVDGQGSLRQHCLDASLPAANGTNGQTTVDRVIPWKTDDKVAVLVVHLKANPEAQGYAVELVPNGKTWLVADGQFIKGDLTDNANVSEALS